MLRLLNARGLQALLRSHGLFAGGPYIVRGGGANDDEDDGLGYGSSRFNRRRRPARHPPPKVPSENGIALMNSGFYGNNPSYADEARRRKKKLATRIMWRELGIGAPGERRRDTRLVFQV
jgi:WD repeat-containing protein 23